MLVKHIILRLRQKISPEVVALSVILLLSFGLRLVFYHEPLERDEGFYACIAQEILHGGVPYRDVIDVKPPGIFYIYSFIISIFGGTTEAIRLFTDFYAIFTVLFIFLLTRYIYNSKAAIIAALCYGVFSNGPILQGNSSNTEIFMILPLVCGAYMYLKGQDLNNRFFLGLSGFLSGVAILIKPVALPNLLLIMFFLACTWGSSGSLRKKLLDLVAFSLPPLVLAVLVVLFFVWKDAFGDLYYWNVTFMKTLGQTQNRWFRLWDNGLKIASEQSLLWLTALPTVVMLLIQRRNRNNLFLVAFLLVSFVGVSMPGKYFVHYFIQIVPALAVLTGIGLAALWEKKGAVLFCSIPILLASTVWSFATDYPYYFVYSPAEVSIKKYGSDIFVNDAVVASYVNRHTEPGDYIFQWGWEPGIYFLSDRRPPNKFIAMMFVQGAQDPDNAVQELVNSILITKPKYILVQHGRENWPGFYELSLLVQKFYHLETTLGGIQLFHFNG